MTLRHLNVFVCVCELGSVTKAADELAVAQPAVSKTIFELENYYGVPLFLRIKRRLILTPEGKELLAKARNVLKAFSEFEETARKKQTVTHVSIGSSLTIGKTIMPDLIKDIKASFSNVEIKAYINRTSEIEKMISEGEIDFAFIEGTPSNADIASEEIASDMILAVAAKNYEVSEPLTAETIVNYDIMLREKGSASRDYFESVLLQNHSKSAPFLESASNQALIFAALKGLGIAVLPQRIVSEYIKNGQLRQIKTDLFSVPRKSFIICGKGVSFVKIKSEIYDFCKQKFGKKAIISSDR